MIPQVATITADGTVDLGEWAGGQGCLHLNGTFGSGTIALKASPDEGTTKDDVDASVTSLTENGMYLFRVPKGYRLYVVTSGSTTPSVKVWLSLAERNRS